MKKTIWSLAALMFMAASVMTSCSNELDVVASTEEAKENVVTLTIKMPEQAETRVGIDNNTLKLNGWEQGDVVKVYKVTWSSGISVEGGIEFTCQNPSEGIFTGTLPGDKTLSDYNFAVYGHDIVADQGSFAGFTENIISGDLKDVLLLAGPISAGTCTMAIHNNVIKVTNNSGEPVRVAWNNGNFVKLWYLVCDEHGFLPVNSGGSCNHTSSAANTYSSTAGFSAADPITIPTGTSYISMPPTKETVGLFNEEGDPVIPAKPHVDSNGKAVVGKLYKVTIVPPVTGTAKATIGGNEVDVKWVQLWENGPMFAEYDVADKLEFTDAVKTGSDYVWGANWRTPSKDEMEELLKAASSTGSTMVTFTVKRDASGNILGFTFAGKGAYQNSLLFFPADQVGGENYAYSHYWTSTPFDGFDGSKSYEFCIMYFNGFTSSFGPSVNDTKLFVRPVLVGN